MNEFWILIFGSIIATNSLDKAETVKLELKTFDEIFGEGWWDKGEAAEDLKMPAPTNFGQNVHHQIDRQNTQIGQIEPNSTDQNLPLTESDHSYNAEDERKQKFDQMKAELTRAGFKNSYKKEIDKTVAKELGLSFGTICSWKSELGQIKPQNKYAHSEQKEMMKRYYEIKDQNPKISDKEIVKLLKIGTDTLVRWKRQFKRQKFLPNSVDGHSVEKNVAANVQEIGSSNLGSI
uniref:Transposase n=1 Tax=Globodera rostochiensis TaxID=31243 RepID=A0A914HSC6_GLORO